MSPVSLNWAGIKEKYNKCSFVTGGIHHICIEVNDINAAVADIKVTSLLAF
jgi:hypothetical protein